VKIRGIHPDAERQRKNGDGRKRGTAPQITSREAEILQDRLQPPEDVAIACGIGQVRAIAEHSRRLALGLFRRRALRHQIGDALLHVELEFIIDLVVEPMRAESVA
jgi:hypothetical protein